jgi:hypothetical protein
MQANVNIGSLLHALKHTQAALDRATVNDPHLTSLKLFQEMRFTRTNARKARHLSDAAPF